MTRISRAAFAFGGGLAAVMHVHAQTGALSGLPLRRDAADDPSMTGAWIFLGALVAVAIAAVWFRRVRKATGIATPGLQRVESLALTSHVSLHVVRWGDEELLVGCGQGAVDLVSRRPARPPSSEVAS